MTAYYNDNDPFAAAWLRELIADGLIAPGDVDDRSIEDVAPADLDGYAQCHLFAGIGGWSLALRLAGWPDDRPVWTGSCPCPPFSAAGKRQNCPSCESRNLVWHPGRTGHAVCADCGHAWLADARHLWPEMWRLVAHRRPSVCFGEQVASRDGLDWLVGVRASLEICSYVVGASDYPAAGVGAPHPRQRIFWVADAQRWASERPRHKVDGTAGGVPEAPRQQRLRNDARNGVATRRVGHAEELQRDACRDDESSAERNAVAARAGGIANRLGDSTSARRDRREERNQRAEKKQPVLGAGEQANRLGDANGPRHAVGAWLARDDGSEIESPGGQAVVEAGAWRAAPILCDDGKRRLVPCDAEGNVEPALFPLAHAGAVRNRVGLLRGSGNAIVAAVAAAFIGAWMEMDR